MRKIERSNFHDKPLRKCPIVKSLQKYISQNVVHQRNDFLWISNELMEQFVRELIVFKFRAVEIHGINLLLFQLKVSSSDHLRGPNNQERMEIPSHLPSNCL